VKPFFSVVIPVYNGASKLKLTLESVIGQRFTDFEVLVMDDGSTDNAEAVVKSFGDGRIRYEWAANSGGPATPRNRGIEAASADWICFLDADDRWYPDKLKRVAEVVAAGPSLDLVCHNEVMHITATGRKVPLRYGPVEPDFYRVMLMSGNRISTSATSVRREFLNKHGLRFNQSRDYVIVEDYDLWLRIALHNGVFYFMDECHGEYLIGEQNISSNQERINHNHLVLLRDHVYNVQKFRPDRDRLWSDINAGLLISKSKNQISGGKYIAGASSLVLALRSSFVGSLKYIVDKTCSKRP
jgi:glycosyltransferase involved in cell wall biosynthesis